MVEGDELLSVGYQPVDAALAKKVSIRGLVTCLPLHPDLPTGLPFAPDASCEMFRSAIDTDHAGKAKELAPRRGAWSNRGIHHDV
jgi:hypothetical protein